MVIAAVEPRSAFGLAATSQRLNLRLLGNEGPRIAITNAMKPQTLMIDADWTTSTAKLRANKPKPLPRKAARQRCRLRRAKDGDTRPLNSCS